MTKRKRKYYARTRYFNHLETTMLPAAQESTQQETLQDSVFLLSQQFWGKTINQDRWKFLIDKLTENEEQVDYNILNIPKLFKLYSKTTLYDCKLRSQLNYYSLVMDDKYLDEMPTFWTGLKFVSYSQFELKSINENNNKPELRVAVGKVEFHWNVTEGFSISVINYYRIKLHELGESAEFCNNILLDHELNVLIIRDGCITKKQNKVN
ncbi:hypothetical protein ABK040_013639 [Willaertia magna]